MAPLNNLQILVTADEGYRAFEKAVVSANTRIDMGFRVFDARMALLTDEAQQFGSTWADLLLAKLDAGVDITIAISDFDPVVRPDLHRGSHKSLSILFAIAEISVGPGKLQASVEDHPARVGWAARIALWPKVQAEIDQTCKRLNDLNEHARFEALRFMPRLSEFTVERDGEIKPKRIEFPAMLPVTHHQKLAVIDDTLLYIGGLDLDHRRHDTPNHDRPASETWHDVHILVEDAAKARSARDHLERFSEECAGERVAVSPPGLLRTLSMKREKNSHALSPEVCDTGIMDRTLELIDQAEDLIYLENQYLRDPVVTDALCTRAKEAINLGMIVLLPAAPVEVAFEGELGLDHQFGDYMQAKCLRQLEEAFGDRMVCTSPAQRRAADAEDRAHICGAPMIFVHSKVSIFDNAAGLVTSANLNGRSMRWDTEMGLEINDPDQVRLLRERTMSAWLPTKISPDFWAPELDTVARWRGLAEANAAVDPTDRRGFVLPHTISPAEDFGTNLPGIPVEMV